MIIYKLDKTKQVKTDAHLKDMNVVISEIAPTLRVLRDLLVEHQNSISEQSINQYREELQRLIPEAIRLTNLISVYSLRLNNVSDRTSKQMILLQDQIAENLKGRSTEEAAYQTTRSTDDTISKQSSAPSLTRSVRFAKAITRS